MEGPPTFVVPFTVIVEALAVAALIEAFPPIAILPEPVVAVTPFIEAFPSMAMSPATVVAALNSPSPVTATGPLTFVAALNVAEPAVVILEGGLLAPTVPSKMTMPVPLEASDCAPFKVSSAP